MLTECWSRETETSCQAPCVDLAVVAMRASHVMNGHYAEFDSVAWWPVQFSGGALNSVLIRQSWMLPAGPACIQVLLMEGMAACR